MKITLLGTGVLGHSMAERLAMLGHEVVVYNRTRAKADALRKFGISVADAPGEAIRASDCVLLLLADAHAIRAVLLSDSARPSLAKRTIIQMGTIGPDDSLDLQRDINGAGGEYFEAPVLGSVAEARAGKLLVMVGGSPEQLRQWDSLFRCFDSEPRLIGPVGHAAACKLALNQLIAAETAAFALSLGLIKRTGISVETFMDVLRASALYAPTFEKKLPRLLTRDYANRNFSARHLLKDVDLCLAASARLKLDASGLKGIRTIVAKTVDNGFDDADYSALYDTVNPPV